MEGIKIIGRYCTCYRTSALYFHTYNHCQIQPVELIPEEHSVVNVPRIPPLNPAVLAVHEERDHTKLKGLLVVSLSYRRA